MQIGVVPFQGLPLHRLQPIETGSIKHGQGDVDIFSKFEAQDKVPFEAPKLDPIDVVLKFCPDEKIYAPCNFKIIQTKLRCHKKIYNLLTK